ncbi:MAG: hypothetical protein EOP61_36035 [Sphingomonadales bacterium]|nr:MAG: hypothetical protein EOP61_36035 [Sphingomonadales bacterium]
MILSAGIYSIAIEAILALLLIIAIAYCMRLDGKLKALRNGNERMLEAAKELQSSALHAQNAVIALRRSADAAGKDLQAKIDEARAVAAIPMVRDARDMPRETDRPTERGNVDFTLRRRSVL